MLSLPNLFNISTSKVAANKVFDEKARAINNNILYYNPGESAGILKGKNAVGVIDLNNLSTKRILF